MAVYVFKLYKEVKEMSIDELKDYKRLLEIYKKSMEEDKTSLEMHFKAVQYEFSRKIEQLNTLLIDAELTRYDADDDFYYAQTLLH